MTISATTQGLRPGVTTSSNRPASPFEGQMIYETDTDKTLVYSGSAWLYSSTPQTTELGAPTAFTPTWTNLAVGTGGSASNVGSYIKVNKLLFMRVRTVLGSSGASVTGKIGMTLPASLSLQGTPQLSTIQSIQVVFVDTGTATVGGWVARGTDTRLDLIAYNVAGTYPVDSTSNASVPFTWVAGDAVEISGWVEVQ